MIMGCNCKNNTKAYESVSDEPIVEERKNVFEVIFKFVAQFLFGILCGVVVLLVIVPLLLYIIACMMFGKQANVDMTWLRKVVGRKKIQNIEK